MIKKLTMTSVLASACVFGLVKLDFLPATIPGSIALNAPGLLPTQNPADATVFLKVDGTGPTQSPASWFGTAVVVTPDGMIVTNRHVVPGDDRRAKSIRAYFHAGTDAEFDCSAELVYVHPERDLALLRCNLGDRTVDYLALKPSSDQLRLEQPMRFAGFPLGQYLSVDEASTPSVSIRAGQVSGLRLNQEQQLWWLDLDTGAIGGNSGGPVLDQDANVVAIMSRARAELSRGIPVDFVHELLGHAGLDVQVGITDDSDLGDRELRLTVNSTLSSFEFDSCLLYTSPSPRDQRGSRMPSSA